MLTVSGLSVRYGSFTAVHDVDLEIADGEVLALLGPSGSGKSTLLRAITGLEPLAQGAVCWDGVDLAPVPVHRRGFGLVFQDGQLFPHRDVAGNIAFGLRMRGMGRAERNDRVVELLDLVGLSGYQRRKVSSLSGGEAQRVALARALAPWPRLLLLDEPLSGLDAELREQLALDLAEVLHQAKITALLVTHDQEEAFTLADRVAILDAGVIQQAGEVLEVWRRPAEERVARFLGATTILTGHAENGWVRSELGETTVPWAPDGAVLLGLRPHALRAVEAGSTGVGGKVLTRAYRRDRIRLSVRPDDGPGRVDAVAALTAEIHPGDTVRLALDPDGVAVIGSATSGPNTGSQG